MPLMLWAAYTPEWVSLVRTVWASRPDRAERAVMRYGLAPGYPLGIAHATEVPLCVSCRLGTTRPVSLTLPRCRSVRLDYAKRRVLRAHIKDPNLAARAHRRHFRAVFRSQSHPPGWG